VLLLSRPEAYAVRRRVIAAEVTTSLRHNPATVEIGRRDGLVEASIVNCDNLVTVNQDDLVEYIATLPPARMREVDMAVLFALGLR
jgi:mRNA interferase MazF